MQEDVNFGRRGGGEKKRNAAMNGRRRGPNGGMYTDIGQIAWALGEKGIDGGMQRD